MGPLILIGSLREPNDVMHTECETDIRSPDDFYLLSEIVGEAYS